MLLNEIEEVKKERESSMKLLQDSSYQNAVYLKEIETLKEEKEKLERISNEEACQMR